MGSNLVVVSRRHTRVHVLCSGCVSRVDHHRNISRKVLFPSVIRFPLSRITVLRRVVRSLSFLKFRLASLKKKDCTVGNIPTNVRNLGPVSLVRGVIRATVRGNNGMGRRIRDVLTLALTGTTTVIPKRILAGRRVANLISNLFTITAPGCAPSNGAILSIVGRSSLRGLFGWFTGILIYRYTTLYPRNG